MQRLIGHGNQFSPVDWVFQGSPDGNSWSTLDTQSGHTSWNSGEIRSFTLRDTTTTTTSTTTTTTTGELPYIARTACKQNGQRLVIMCCSLNPMLPVNRVCRLLQRLNVRRTRHSPLAWRAVPATRASPPLLSSCPRLPTPRAVSSARLVMSRREGMARRRCSVPKMER